MIEKVNPSHPDKIADRICGHIVDLCYKIEFIPIVAVECLIGHGKCHIIIETSIKDKLKEQVENIKEYVRKITNDNKIKVMVNIFKQDVHLNENQTQMFRCGDNGIFKGCYENEEEKMINKIAKLIYEKYPYDGKYILDLENKKLIICQSNCDDNDVCDLVHKYYPDLNIIINPLGSWSGGINVDTGAVNRKLGSDMFRGITGGGIHGKDLSKADVSMNIYAWLKANDFHKNVMLECAIGDTEIDGMQYSDIVKIAKNYIDELGGFEKLAEWGLCQN